MIEASPTAAPQGASTAPAPPPPEEAAARALRLGEAAGRAALLAFPAFLVVYLSFNAGGFFPDASAFATILVLQVLVLRTTLARDPVGGFRVLAWIPAAALALLVVWTLASAAWSDATGRAILEGHRALLYALVFVLFASVRRGPDDLRWMTRAVAAALFGVSVAGLMTRLLPDAFEVDLGLAADRLSHPLTYWNAQGLVAAAGLVLCAHLCSDRREPAVVRSLAAGAVPLLAVTLFFTFSRGAIAGSVVAIVLYLVLTRGGGQLAALAVAGPATAVALVAAYAAEELSSTEPQQQAAVDQGRELALILLAVVVVTVLARFAAATVGERLTRRLMSPATELRAIRATWIGALVATLALLLVVDAPGRVERGFDRFFNGPADIAYGTDLRGRLPVAADSGRVDHWSLALNQFAERPLQGHGAGTYETLWNEERPDESRVIDAHSLYLEALAELGLVGGLLLLVALGGMFVAFAAGLRGPDAALHAGLLAAALVWCLHAAGEWDWEMPAASVWLFALGGLAAARPRREPVASPARPPGRWPIVAALCWIAIAAGPLLVMLSESRLATAEAALDAGDCRTAATKSLDSIELLSSRREPFEVLGFCRAIEGFPRQGREAMQKAVDRDPRNWEPRYALALVVAQAGDDPRPDLTEARRLSPREPLVREFAEQIAEAPRDRWPQVAAAAQDEALLSGRLTIADR